MGRGYDVFARVGWLRKMVDKINRSALSEADEVIHDINDLIAALKARLDDGDDNENGDAKRFYDSLIAARTILRQNRRNILHCLSVAEKSRGGNE